jgi:hypothetical protein
MLLSIASFAPFEYDPELLWQLMHDFFPIYPLQIDWIQSLREFQAQD